MKKAVRFYLLLRHLSNLSQRRLNVHTTRLFSYAALTLYYDGDRNVMMKSTGIRGRQSHFRCPFAVVNNGPLLKMLWLRHVV